MPSQTHILRLGPPVTRSVGKSDHSRLFRERNLGEQSLTRVVYGLVCKFMAIGRRLHTEGEGHHRGALRTQLLGLQHQRRHQQGARRGPHGFCRAARHLEEPYPLPATSVTSANGPHRIRAEEAAQPTPPACNALVSLANDLYRVSPSGAVLTRFTSDGMPKVMATVAPDGKVDCVSDLEKQRVHNNDGNARHESAEKPTAPIRALYGDP